MAHAASFASSRRPAWLAAMGLAAAVVFTSTLAAAVVQESSPLRPASEDQERHAAERLTTRLCGDCHALSAITADRRTPGAWREVVEAMASRGAEGTPAELATVTHLLSRTRGIVAVNTAPAADFTDVLGVSSDIADAIVAHRAAHGRFADMDALLAVPGLDRSRVTGDQLALWFD